MALSLLLSVAAAQSAAPLSTQADPYHLNLPTTSARLQALQQQLAQQKQLSTTQKEKLEALRRNISALSTQQRGALDQLDSLATKIAELQNKKRQIEAQVRAAQSDLAQTSAQVQLTSSRVTRLQSDVQQLLSTLYRERSGQYLRLASQASSLSDLIIRTRYANMSGEHNIQVIDELRDQREDLKAQQSAQARLTVRLQQLRAEQLRQLASLKGAQQQQQALVAQLQRTQQGQRALALQTQAQQALTAQTIGTLVGNVIQERNAIELERRHQIEAERLRRAEELRRVREAQERARQEAARLAAARAEQQRQAAEQQAQAQREAQARAEQQRRSRASALGNEQANLQRRQTQLEAQQQQADSDLSPLPAPSGPLGFPLPSGSVVQPFSSAVPWTVLGAGSGSRAVAALDGNVLAVTNYASLGWVVLVDHGALVTAYFGLAAPNVEVGARVSKGQALGSIGGSPVFGDGRMAFQVNRISGGVRIPVPPTF